MEALLVSFANGLKTFSLFWKRKIKEKTKLEVKGVDEQEIKEENKVICGVGLKEIKRKETSWLTSY